MYIRCYIGNGKIANLTSKPLPVFSKKNCVPLSNFFSSSNMFFIGLLLANTWKKIGGHHARLREKENLFRYSLQKGMGHPPNKTSLPMHSASQHEDTDQHYSYHNFTKTCTC